MILTKDKIKSIDLIGEIDNRISQGLVNKLLIVVPTNRKLRSVKKDIINRSPNKSVTKINTETISTLATKLLQEVKPFEQLSEAAASVFIKQSAESTKLNYFINYKSGIPNGTLDRIKNVISEYKKHNITPEKLFNESVSLESSEKLKAQDISAIYKKFKSLTEEVNAYEIGDVYEHLINVDKEKFNAIFSKLFNQVELVALLGFDQFTVPEVKIISSISEFVNNKLYIDFDYNQYNPLIFSHLEDTSKLLESFDFHGVEDESLYEFTEFTQAVREKLFLQIEKRKISKYKNRIKIISGRNTEEEIELIAKQIKTLIVDDNVAPHNMAVVFNLISEYSPIVKDIFEKYGIPFNLTDRTSLDQSIPVTSFINVLEIGENDFYYKNIFRAFSGRFLKHYEIDVVNLNYVASKLKIISGYRNWINTIENELHNQSNDDEKISAGRLEKALQDIAKIHELIQPFNKKLTPIEFYNLLIKFLTESQITITVLKGDENYREEDIAALITFIETIEELLHLIEKQSKDDEKYSLTFYLDQIKTACSWARFNIKGRSDFGVLVTSVNEIRGLTSDYLFIAGLNDGIFPTRYNPEIFFSGSFAKKEITHQTEERFHFYQSLCTWRKSLYLSTSSFNRDRELIHSIFLKDFVKLFEAEEITHENFKDSAFTLEDVQINYGSLIGVNSTINEDAATDLIDLNDLNKKIAAQKVRTSTPHIENSINGFVSLNNDSIITLALDEFKDREYSISQLETYAKCPFKYFLQYVLKLSDIGEPTEEVEPIELGSILHKILYEFYSELRDQKISLKNCTERELQKAQKIIFSIGERNLDSPLFTSEISFYEREKILGIDGNQKDSILYQFLKNEKENSDNSIPSYFEVAFGSIESRIKDPTLSSSQSIIGGNVKFKGKIDRIDVNESDSTFDIVDYKLSLNSKPTKSDISDGISLQLPLYMFAAKQLFERKEIQFSPSEVYLYSLKFNENELKRHKISIIPTKSENRDREIENLMNETITKIELYIESIVKGEFPLTSLPDRERKVCNFCNFGKICRVEETDL